MVRIDFGGRWHLFDNLIQSMFGVSEDAIPLVENYFWSVAPDDELFIDGETKFCERTFKGLVDDYEYILSDYFDEEYYEEHIDSFEEKCEDLEDLTSWFVEYAETHEDDIDKDLKTDFVEKLNSGKNKILYDVLDNVYLEVLVY